MKAFKAQTKKLLKRFHWPVSSMYSFSGNLLRKIHPEWQPRYWSNLELKKWGTLVTGDIINVSGWQDSDKHGGRYADYFPNKKSYAISNIPGARGSVAGTGEIFLDLTQDLPADLRSKFDVVFNHTVLEHVYPLQTAIQNLCALSRDLVLIVVPFLQQMHWEEGSYQDYWRLTPFALKKLFKENGFEVIYCSDNDNPVTDVYLFCVASKTPHVWIKKLQTLGIQSTTTIPGSHFAHLRMPKA